MAQLPATTDALAGDFLKSFGRSLKDYAVREYNQTSFLKSAMIAIADNKDLSDCLTTDAGKRSLFAALRYAATTGLSLNPQEGKAALIPYGGKIQYQVMKNGLIELALESGKVEFITADYVKENDKFSIKKTVHGDEYSFEPALKDRGEILGYFAALKMKSGVTHVKWFTAEEIEKHRKAYSERSKMPETAYGIKTVLKALLRSISISDELDNAIGADDFFEAEFKVHGISADDAAEKLKAEKEKKTIDKSDKESLL